jgi:hypothetical protein
LLAVDPNGQETKLSLRKFHIDVFIEDGFARTTIDQTYFNEQPFRMEGTFFFPLPADASLSRLAMYVDGKRMEGGMTERDYARQVFDSIVSRMRDPALLEWVDGTTFKMRVFPLEGRQEKRIILSYTQRLPSLYGRQSYRFPAGHSLQVVRDWSFHARVKNAQGMACTSPSHPSIRIVRDGTDLLLDLAEQNCKVNQDLALELADSAPPAADVARFSSTQHEQAQYLMLRYRPLLPAVGSDKRQPRDWVFLFESSADRDPLLARVQVDVIATLLGNIDHDDTFSILTAGTRVQRFAEQPVPATPENIKSAVAFLEQTHLIGTLDLANALSAALPVLEKCKNPYVVQVGAGIASLGERRQALLVKILPSEVPYIGIGVGRRWNRGFMKAAAERSGGFVTQINPDEPVAWRAFDLLATLNTPRLLNIKVVDNAEKAVFLTHSSLLSQGEELCAIARLPSGESRLPDSLTITGTLDGKPYYKVIPVKQVAGQADYLPRTWAKLEIDRLLAENAEAKKPALIALSKAMYVMTPYTSLLVLENEAMYQQYNVDRGRKDHWAMYPCPETIPVVKEPLAAPPAPPRLASETPTSLYNVLQTIRRPQAKNEVSGFIDDGASSLAAKSRMRAKLSTPITLLHGIEPNTPFKDALEFIVDRYDLPVVVDREAFMQDNQDQSVDDKPVRLPRMVGVSLNTVLRLLAAQINGACLVRRDYIEITTPNRAMAEGVPLRVYAVADLVTPIPVSLGGRTSGQSQWDNEVRIWDASSGRDLSLCREDRLRAIAFSRDGYQLPTRGFGGLGGIGGLGGSSVTWSRDGRRVQGAPLTGFNRIQGPGLANNPANELDDDLNGDIPELWNGVGSYPALRASPSRASTGRLLIYGNTGTRHNVIQRQLPRFPGQFLTDPNRRVHQLLNNSEDLRPVDSDEWQRIWFTDPPLPYLIPERVHGGIDDNGPGPQPIFYDLLSHAPGMRTTEADILAVLDAEVLPTKAVARGMIDPRARKLIDGARQRGWQTLVVPAQGGQQAFDLSFDDSGRYAYERISAEGLREKVICDGKTLLHLYPELGIGARRTVSRFHAAEFAQLTPWIPLSADDLSYDFDVSCQGAHTVVLAPRGAASTTRPDGKPASYACVQLIFAPTGSLAERRSVLMPSGKVLSRETYTAGIVRLFDTDGKEVVKQDWKVRAAQVPDLRPDTGGLVVLPLPWRTRKHVEETLKLDTSKPFRALVDDDQAVAVFAAELATNQGQSAQTMFQERFKARGDQRLGFYTLLTSFGHSLASQPDELQNHAGKPDEPLARYLAYISNWSKKSGAALGDIGGDPNGLLARLAAFHDLDHWFYLDRAPAFIRHNRGSVLGWAILGKAHDLTADGAIQRTLADLCPLFADIPGLASAVAYERACCLLDGGQPNEACKEFRTLYETLLNEGELSPLSKHLRRAFRESSSDTAAWSAWLHQLATMLVKQDRPEAVIVLAWQCRQLEDNALADELFATVKDRSLKEYPSAALLGLEYLRHADRLAEAAAKLRGWLTEPEAARTPSLWRLGSELALEHHELGEAAAYLEKALDLEYQQLPEVINVEAVRAGYSPLMDLYQQLADAVVAWKIPGPEDFAARVIRTADRWRSLDSDSAAACQAAGLVLATLGDREAAWDYLTTATGQHANDSGPWLTLAKTLRDRSETQLADRAYAVACQCDPADAQIVWDRAVYLQQCGKTTQAWQLFHRLATGVWDPKFAALQEQARRQLRGY